MLSLIIVDNHTIEREGISSLFDTKTDIQIIGSYSNGEECLNDIENKKQQADIILCDLELPDMSGFELYSEIHIRYSKTKFIIFTEDNSNSNLIKSFDLDINGYILKTIGFKELLEVINKVDKGMICYEPNLLPTINKKLLERDTHQELLDRLTKREKQMLICVANGLSNKEIASECHISERTVKNHLSSVFQKIEVVDRTQAAVFAIKTNLVKI